MTPGATGTSDASRRSPPPSCEGDGGSGCKVCRLLACGEEATPAQCHCYTRDLARAPCYLSVTQGGRSFWQRCIFHASLLYFLFCVSQPFSKKAVDHVQSHLAKKQVPPTLFQVTGLLVLLLLLLLILLLILLLHLVLLLLLFIFKLISLCV